MGPVKKPAALFWGFVDDFMIHAPTQVKCGHALSTFMNLMLQLSIMCQKVKLKPPAQVQKYTGFLFDMTSIPTLRIPPNKCDHGLVATIHFLKAGVVFPGTLLIDTGSGHWITPVHGRCHA